MLHAGYIQYPIQYSIQYSIQYPIQYPFNIQSNIQFNIQFNIQSNIQFNIQLYHIVCMRTLRIPYHNLRFFFPPCLIFDWWFSTDVLYFICTNCENMTKILSSFGDPPLFISLPVFPVYRLCEHSSKKYFGARRGKKINNKDIVHLQIYLQPALLGGLSIFSHFVSESTFPVFCSSLSLN